MSYVNVFHPLNEFGEAAFEATGLGDGWRRSVFDNFCPKEFHQLQPRGGRHSDDNIIMHYDVTLAIVGGH